MIFNLISLGVEIFLSIFLYLQLRENYNLMAIGCRKASNAFTDFAERLTVLLRTPRDRRANPTLVINFIQSDYKKLTQTYSDYKIHSSIYRKFVKKIQGKTILCDIMDDTVQNGLVEKNIILDKFIDVLIERKKIQQI